jgi:hypothetical protein
LEQRRLLTTAPSVHLQNQFAQSSAVEQLLPVGDVVAGVRFVSGAVSLPGLLGAPDDEAPPELDEEMPSPAPPEQATTTKPRRPTVPRASDFIERAPVHPPYRRRFDEITKGIASSSKRSANPTVRVEPGWR